MFPLGKFFYQTLWEILAIYIQNLSQKTWILVSASTVTK